MGFLFNETVSGATKGSWKFCWVGFDKGREKQSVNGTMTNGLQVFKGQWKYYYLCSADAIYHRACH